MRSFIHNAYKNASEYILPPLSESRFEQKGVLTPEEFVEAGDFLVRNCPTWSWESGDDSKRWSFLPRNKQYLTTKNVPCFRRASAIESYQDEPQDQSHDSEEGYDYLPGTSDAKHSVYDIDQGEIGKDGGQNVEDILDISNLDIEDEEEIDEGAAPYAGAAHTESKNQVAGDHDASVILTRKYTLIISYDKYYQVPRVWLIGYKEDGSLLSHTEIMEDVIGDYHDSRRKTVTIEQHPHKNAGGSVVSIHPCQHGAVMKKLSSLIAGEKGFNIEQYMVLFLKFISSVVPTIEYDYTMAFGAP